MSTYRDEVDGSCVDDAMARDGLNDELHAYANEWVEGSTSSLSGGFTTITNLDIGVADGGGCYENGSPSRSVFKVLGAMDSPSMTRTASNPYSNDNDSHLGSHIGSFQSYYEMQKRGPFIPDTHLRQEEVLKHQESSYVDDAEHDVDLENNGFCEHAEYGNVDSDLSTDGNGSSLSSITNDFFGKGRFSRYGRQKKGVNNVSASPQSSDKNSSPKSPKTMDTVSNSNRKRNTLVSGPWFSKIQLQPQHQPDTPHKQIQEQHPDTNREPMSSPDPEVARPPKEVVITPKGRPEDLTSFSSPCDSPSVISSNFSEFFTNELRERYRRSIHRSYRHHYNQLINSSPRAKKIMAISLSLVFLLLLIAVTTLVMGSRGNKPIDEENDMASLSTYDEVSLPSGGVLPEVCCVGNYGDPKKSDDPTEEFYQSSFDGGDEPVEESSSSNAVESTPDSGIATPTHSPTQFPPASNTESSEPTEQSLATPANDSSPEEVHFSKDKVNLSQIGEPGNSESQSSPPPSHKPSNAPTSGAPVSSPPSTVPTMRPTRQPTSEPTKEEFTFSTSSFSSAQIATPQPSKFPTSERPTEEPSRRPTPASRPEPRPVSITPKSSVVHIKAVDTTIDESRPNTSYGADSYLSIKGSSRVALLKFNIGPLMGYHVATASLRLYSAINVENLEEASSGRTNVKIDVLPNAGNWKEDSVAWDNRPRSAGSFRAASFSVNFRPDHEGSHKHKVDVTWAIESLLHPADGTPLPSTKRSQSSYVTFRLSTSSDSTIDFASREWNDGVSEPELSILLSDPEPSSSPSRGPTSTPTSGPTQAPTTSAPTTNPTSSPVIITTTTTSTTTTSSTTSIFDDCPSEYDTSEIATYSYGSYVSVPGTINGSSQTKHIYQCTSTNCDVQNQLYAPGGAYSSVGGWTLVGSCVEVVTYDPTLSPSYNPTTFEPTRVPSKSPTKQTSTPTKSPGVTITTTSPTSSPIPAPSTGPTRSPVAETNLPTREPSMSPTLKPSPTPTPGPTFQLTPGPTHEPTSQPTHQSTHAPTFESTPQPTPGPTFQPSLKPVTSAPTASEPSEHPTAEPTPIPTKEPSRHPTPDPTLDPTPLPTAEPTPEPTPNQ